MSTARARKSSPIFAATIVPTSVEPLTTCKGAPYTRMTKATVLRNGKPSLTRTILAFGRPNETIQHLLVPGKPIKLTVQQDGGSLKVIGLPRTASQKDAATTILPEGVELPSSPYTETAIAEIASILWMFDIDNVASEPIIQEMLTGESDRPVDGPDEGEPHEAFELMMEHFGHIMNPLLNAGIPIATAARITDLILEIPAGDFLYDMRRLREQQSVHGLLDQAA